MRNSFYRVHLKRFVPFKAVRIDIEKAKKTCGGRLNNCDVSFSCVSPVIDHKFRHHIVKVAVDPRGDSRKSMTTVGSPVGNWQGGGAGVGKWAVSKRNCGCKFINMFHL